MVSYSSAGWQAGLAAAGMASRRRGSRSDLPALRLRGTSLTTSEVLVATWMLSRATTATMLAFIAASSLVAHPAPGVMRRAPASLLPECADRAFRAFLFPFPFPFAGMRTP